MIEDQRKRAGRKKRTAKTFRKVGAVLSLPKQNTIIRDRLVDAAVALSDQDQQQVTFQHTVFCQTSLPYRDPGDDVRVWERINGRAHLEILAGKAMHPELERLVPVGLPFGPKSRLILMHLNAEAKRTGSPDIEVEESLTAFVKRLKLNGNGRDMRTIKDQLTRLSSSSLRLGVVREGRATTINSNIVSQFDIWFPKDDRQRVLWPSTVRLSGEYFESLMAHAVPLDEIAVASLSHSAMSLDVYAWLAQRLHRIPKPHRQLVPWTSLKEQFGPDYSTIRKFRQVFMVALRQVHTVYRAAKIDVTDEGLFLYTSPPPVAKTGMVLTLPRP